MLHGAFLLPHGADLQAGRPSAQCELAQRVHFPAHWMMRHDLVECAGVFPMYFRSSCVFCFDNKTGEARGIRPRRNTNPCQQVSDQRARTA